MKSTSLLPWIYLAIVAGSQSAHADLPSPQPLNEGLVDYRQGDYFQAAQILMKANQVNNAFSDYYMGKMRLYGFGLLKNNTLALRYLTRAAEQGLLPAQQWLARYYLFNNQPDLALNWFKKAADKADYQSQMYVSAAYLFGYGTHENSDAARKYFIDAARGGHALAQYSLGMDFLGSRDKSNHKIGILWLNKAAEQGYAKAEYQLGVLYDAGKVTAADPEKAQALLKKAAERHYVAAQYYLAQLYLDPKNKLYDEKQGFDWMKQAATSGSADAQEALSDIYHQGKIVPVDLALAKQWQSKAQTTRQQIEKNAPTKPAQRVALWLTEDATQHFEKSPYALGGIFNAWHNPMALQENNYNPSPQMPQINRQELYQPQFALASPKDISINDYFDFMSLAFGGNSASRWTFPIYPIDQAIQALEDSHSAVLAPAPWCSVVDDGRTYPAYPNESLSFFDQYTAGWQLQVNYQQVLTYLYQRAILGDADAQFKLAQLYQYGVVLNRSIPQAIIYYELAALQQDVRAEYNLGVLYLEGKTDPVDYQKGLDWIMDAAFKGNAYAQFALANIYDNGLINQQGQTILTANHQQAMAMYYLASANHYNQAQFRLAESLTQENNGVLSVSAKQNRTALVRRLFEDAARTGVVEAILPAAFYEAMDADTSRQQHAYQVAKSQAEAGSPLASLLLGMMVERGLGTASNPDEAIHWYQQATLNPVSEFILGTYYMQGIGVSQDADKGQTLLQQSADGGFAYAHYNLAIIKKGLGEPFLPELNKAREAGNSKAGLLLADYYLQQANDPEKMQQSRDIYQHFADKGEPTAQLKLAFLYDRGLGGPVNYDTAAYWYTLSAKQGQPVSQYLLGLMYQQGKVGGIPDYEQSKKWYGLAREKYAPAAVALGFVNETVDDNYTAAVDNYQLAVKQGSTIGRYNLGLIYEDGKGQPVDESKAVGLYQAAADEGSSSAMMQLAGLYFKGIHGERDEDKAIALYKKAADLGNREANYQLGLLSETGVGMALDFPSALKFYQRAADLGDEKASLAMARMYQFGLGVPKDITHASEIYRQLAANSNAFAQYQLAVLCYDGSLGQVRADEGKKWLVAASANGSVQASHMMSWLDAQQAQRVSFIEPVTLHQEEAAVVSPEPQQADLMYLDALNHWNRGDEVSSRCILHRLVKQYPNYVPAKRIVDQLG